MIQDPLRRERSLTVVGQNWYRKNPDAAAAWLEDKDLSEEAWALIVNPPAQQTEAPEKDIPEDGSDAEP
jgi:hypothetical protein